MKNLENIAFCAGVLAVLLCPARAAGPAEEDLVENPDYAGWVRFRPGDFVKARVLITIGERTAVQEETSRLVSVDKDKVVVEVVATAADGKAQPPTTRTFSARLPKDSLPQFKDAGTDSVLIGNREFNCTIRQVLLKAGRDGQEEIGKIWVCDRMPGGAVKVVSESGGRKVEGIVVEFKASV